ncbi:IS3 family transposase [Paenibacillus sp. UMB7766-LJ446]|uniref:IS3 family transposase n=1 Tax=Paenibacillus sp. UMB7766-LJ446 TaxID=3046313 RepID=UPI00254A45C6|nr:IS3 family transposase [Paenibacillus sp. UMB7766-LJ446]MDK8193181.1 IS3 family transposase [Paenibacillus sp. UMB7766-LJ446]
MEKVAAYGDIQKLCHVFGVYRSVFYAYVKLKRIDRDAKAKKQVLQTYQRYEGKYGYRQLQLFLWQDQGIWMNHKKVLRLMQMLGIQSRIRRKRRSSSSYAPAERVAENRLKRHFSAEKPNQKWVTDITHYRVESAGYIFQP